MTVMSAGEGASVTRTGRGLTLSAEGTGPGEDPPPKTLQLLGGAVPHPGREGVKQARGRRWKKVCLAAGGRGLQGRLVFFWPLQAPGEPTLWEKPHFRGMRRLVLRENEGQAGGSAPSKPGPRILVDR